MRLGLGGQEEDSIERVKGGGLGWVGLGWVGRGVGILSKGVKHGWGDGLQGGAMQYSSEKCVKSYGDGRKKVRRGTCTRGRRKGFENRNEGRV